MPQVDKLIRVTGFGIWGGKGTYSGISISIRLGNSSSNGEIIGTQNGLEIQDIHDNTPGQVYFDSPVTLEPDTRYTLVAKLPSGKSVYSGNGGQSARECAGVNFSFFSAQGGNNGTSVSGGQIPQILFEIPGSKPGKKLVDDEDSDEDDDDEDDVPVEWQDIHVAWDHHDTHMERDASGYARLKINARDPPDRLSYAVRADIGLDAALESVHVWKIKFHGHPGEKAQVGLCHANTQLSTTTNDWLVGGDDKAWAWNIDGGLWHQGLRARKTANQFKSNDEVTVTADFNEHRLEFALNGVTVGVGFTNLPPSGVFYPCAATNQPDCQIEIYEMRRRPNGKRIDKNWGRLLDFAGRILATVHGDDAAPNSEREWDCAQCTFHNKAPASGPFVCAMCMAPADPAEVSGGVGDGAADCNDSNIASIVECASKCSDGAINDRLAPWLAASPGDSLQKVAVNLGANPLVSQLLPTVLTYCQVTLSKPPAHLHAENAHAESFALHAGGDRGRLHTNEGSPLDGVSHATRCGSQPTVRIPVFRCRHNNASWS